MEQLLEVVRVYQVLVVFAATGVISVVGWMVAARIRLLVEDKASVSSVTDLRSTVAAVDQRVTGLEFAARAAPTMTQMQEIVVALSDIRGELKAGTERFEGIETLIERMDQQLNNMDQYLRRMPR